MWTFLRIMYRKIELQYLYRVANSRRDEIDVLIRSIGAAFLNRTLEKKPRFSGIRWITLPAMGYAVDSVEVRIAPICWNAPIGVIVYLDDHAYFGLGVELRGRALCIRQMQGVRGALPSPELLDWPELFVSTCMISAAEMGCTEVRVYKANQDFNFAYPQVEPPEGQDWRDAAKVHRDRMRRRYDRTAQKLKFTKKRRYYVWKVPKTQPD